MSVSHDHPRFCDPEYHPLQVDYVPDDREYDPNTAEEQYRREEEMRELAMLSDEIARMA
jgi:hypothetical protein